MVLTVGHHLSQRLQAFFCIFVSSAAFRKTNHDLQLPCTLQQSCKIVQGMHGNRWFDMVPAEWRRWRLSEGRDV
jgi:hypothetical protein